MSMFFNAGFQVINLLIVLVFIALWIYVLILLINFLKKGTQAFQKYLDTDKGRDDYK